MNLPDEFPLDFAGIESTPPHASEKQRAQLEFANTVAAVVAMEHSRPIRPHKDSIEKIHRSISRHQPLSHKNRWLVASGWAAAAAIALFSFLHPESQLSKSTPDSRISQAPQSIPVAEITPPTERPTPVVSPAPIPQTAQAVDRKNQPVELVRQDDAQRKLIQEIETLRKEVKILAGRDTERLVVRGGITWPVIMKLTCPGTNPAAAIVKDPLLSAMLDAQPAYDQKTMETLEARNQEVARVAAPEARQTVQTDDSLPSAVPIYDPARDQGQLMVNNLATPAEGNDYFLWVKSDKAADPVLVGTLPQNVADNETFSFQLGSQGIIPDGFLITQDAANAPSPPSSSNTILLRPENP